ncbi:MAG: ABC transporter permease subunit [Acidimicrobiales bacterium]|jgi:ABC-type transport system involved in multi-copper enzyme maturation permease subunit
MTIITTTIPPPTTPRYRLGAVMRSEWTKMRSVRSTTRTLALTVALTIGIGIIATSTEAGRWTHASAATRLTFDPTNLSLTGILFGQIMIGILGVLVVSAEYGTGTIRASLAAVPNRRLFLVAKATSFAIVAFLVGEVVSFVAFFGGQSLISGGAPHATITQPDVLGAVIGSGLYLTVLGLLAVGLGLTIRHTAGALAAFVGILLIVPLLTPAFPASIQNAVSKFEPTTIGNAMTVVTTHLPKGSAPTFSPWVGLAILGAYAAVALGIGAWSLLRRDA